MKFTKMHGIGNDYVYVNCFTEKIDNPSEVSRKVSDRHFGIGSDGLILIKPSEKADFEMEMYNADGSQGAMCGNGIRCLGKYVYDRKLTTKTCLTLEAGGGVRTVDLQVEGGKVAEVTVDMGVPQVGKPMALQVEGIQVEGTPVWMGNPHLVCLVEDVAAVDVTRLGPQLEYHPKLFQQVNVEFVAPQDRGRIAMRVWERGSGETMACGTGASAALAALASSGVTERRAVVSLPGGELSISWGEDGHVHMTGPAVTVFDGELAH